MDIEKEYYLSQYQDLGKLGDRETIRLKRNIIYGVICVEKRVSPSLKNIYEFLQKNPSPYIPEIYECFLGDGELIIIEEYITGRTLEDIVREKRLSEEETVQKAREIGCALQFLHHAEPPIICRDLKAENIMIDSNQRVKLVDFDIARIYQKGKRRDTRLMGTAGYAAPEQYGFFQTDNRTDIFAMGILINYMVTGKFPVEEMVQGRLYQIVHKSTYMNPEERYQTVEELLDELFRLYPEYEKSSGANKEVKKEKRYSFTPPGFRSKTPWKIIVAVIGYLFLTWLCFSMEISSSKIVLSESEVRFEQAAIWISQMAFLGVICNYRGVREELPFVSSGKKSVRIAGYIFAEFCLLFIAAFICAIAETFIF